MQSKINIDVMQEGKRLESLYKGKQAGDRFEFGRYPQGKNGEEKPIIWRVLRRDSDSLLVIAEMGLDVKPYNEECVDITWADCTLRCWLNDVFYKRAFNQQERSLIKKIMLANNAGPSTGDYIFLLSVNEVEDLFADNDDRVCKPTDYAIKNGVWTYDGRTPENVAYKGNAWWWLRSRGDFSNLAMSVDFDGDIGDDGCYVNSNFGAVRPALQIAIRSLTTLH